MPAAVKITLHSSAPSGTARVGAGGITRVTNMGPFMLPKPVPATPPR